MEKIRSYSVYTTQALKQFRVLSILWISTGFGAALAFLTQTYMARTLGPSDFGVIMGALTGMGLLVPIVGLGVAQFWLQAYGEEGIHAKRWMQPMVRVFGGGIAICCTIVVILALLSKQTGYTPIIIFLLITHVFGQSANELSSSQYQIEGRYYALALIQLTPHLTRLALIILLGFFYTTALGFVVVYSIIGLLTLAIASIHLLEFHRKSSIFELTQLPTAAEVLKRSLPFGLAGFFHLIYFQSNVTAINILHGSNGAGLYSAAFGVIAALYLLPSVLYQKFLLPKLHRWGNHDKKKFVEIFRAGSVAMLLLGILLCISLIIFAEAMIALLFGPKFKESTEILNILAISVPFMFVSHSSGSALIKSTHTWGKAMIMGGVALLNVTACLFLIPAFGVKGAAWANVISNAALCITYTIFAIFVSNKMRTNND